MNTFDHPTIFRSTVNFQGAVNLAASSVGDLEFDGSDPLTAAKQKHVHKPTYSQGLAADAADAEVVIHIAKGGGTLTLFEATFAGAVAAAGAATVTFDLKKNGTTVLSAVAQIDSGTAQYAKEAGTISVASYAAGDVFTLHVDATIGGGTLPKGVCAHPTFVEDYS